MSGGRGGARGGVRRTLAWALGLALAGGASPPSAAALDLNQWIPGLRVTPFITEKVEYNSNVFQVPTDTQDDVIFWTVPGVVVDYTLGNYTLSFGYRAEIQNYLELTDQNFVNHIGAVQFLAELPRLTLTFRNDFVRTNEPPISELSGPIPSNTNNLLPEVEYRFTPRLSMGVNVGWIHVDYEDPAAEVIDRDEYQVGLTAFWRLFTKGDVRFDVAYRHAQFKHDESRDVDYYLLSVGLRGDITEKLSSTFRIGLQVRDAKTGQDGFTGLAFTGDLVYRPRSTTTITLSALRTTQDSAFGAQPFYVTTGGGIAVRQELLRRLTLEARIGGGINEYPGVEVVDGVAARRKDGFLTAGLNLEYQVRDWLLLGVEYRHNFRRSSFPLFEFDQDRVQGKATVLF
jgi:hypothetical protein